MNKRILAIRMRWLDVEKFRKVASWFLMKNEYKEYHTFISYTFIIVTIEDESTTIRSIFISIIMQKLHKQFCFSTKLVLARIIMNTY